MMRRGSSLNIIVLALVSFFVLGFWCNASAAPPDRTSSSVLVSSPSTGPDYICSEPLPLGTGISITVAKTSNLSRSRNPGVVGEFFVFSPTDSLRIQPNLLSGRDHPFFPKVSLQILNSVFIL
jgi:hypothetical protein